MGYNVRITTEICGKHFAILRYASSNIVDVKKAFNRLNSKFNFRETWFVNVDDMIFSISFGMYTWSKYKSMIYSKGISVNFRNNCLRDRFGSITLKRDSKYGILYKFNEENSFDELKNNVEGMFIHNTGVNG